MSVGITVRLIIVKVRTISQNWHKVAVNPQENTKR